MHFVVMGNIPIDLDANANKKKTSSWRVLLMDTENVCYSGLMRQDYNVVSTGAKTGNNITINRWVSARGSYKCHCDLTELHRFRSTSHVVVLMMSHYLVQFTR